MAWSFLTYSLAVILLISLPISVHHQKLWSDDDEHPKASSTSKIVNQTDNKFTHKPEIGIHQPRSNDVFVDIPKPGLGTFVGFSIPINYSPGQNQSFSRKPTLINAFLGIPYAAPPVGDLRFQRPKPSYLNQQHPWFARKYRSACMQSPVKTRSFPDFNDYSEDCLFLNIFYPNISAQKTYATASSSSPASLLPVLVHIHGGSYSLGSSHTYPGLALASTGLVIVTLNYRLNVFGFLSTGTSDLPGNYGLWDQLMALKWVKDNIAFFGGDPNRVTLMGESAGAASVGLHIVSPVSRKLGAFQQAIMISGSELSSWAVDDPALQFTAFHTRIMTDQMLGCVPNVTPACSQRHKSSQSHSSSSQTSKCSTSYNVSLISYNPNLYWSPQSKVTRTLQCLRYNKTASELLKVHKQLDRLPNSEIACIPVIDGPDGFLPTHPLEALIRNKVKPLPILAGVVRDEGSQVILHGFADSGVTTSTEAIGQVIDSLIENYNPPDVDQLRREVYERYKFNEDPHNTTIRWQRLVELSSDIKINGPLTSKLRLQSSSNSTPVYMYEFNYRSRFDVTASDYGGIYHGIELPFLFGHAFMNQTIRGELYNDFTISDSDQLSASDETDVQLSHLMIQMWSNFVKYGNPMPQAFDGTIWTPYNASDEAYLWIGAKSDMKTKFRSDNMAFWHQQLVESREKDRDRQINLILILVCLSAATVFLIVIFLSRSICRDKFTRLRPGGNSPDRMHSYTVDESSQPT